MTDDKGQYSDEDLEDIRKLKERMYLCWLEMIGAEMTDAHLAEMRSAREELSRILSKYGEGGKVQ